MAFTLPDTIPISAELLRLVSEIDEFKGHWRAWQSLTPGRLQGLRRVATIESIGSSTRIEGSRLSDREVEALFETHETLTNAQAAALSGANRSTLKAKFAELISAGLVEAHGKGRGAFYTRKPPC